MQYSLIPTQFPQHTCLTLKSYMMTIPKIAFFPNIWGSDMNMVVNEFPNPHSKDTLWRLHLTSTACISRFFFLFWKVKFPVSFPYILRFILRQLQIQEYTTLEKKGFFSGKSFLKWINIILLRILSFFSKHKKFLFAFNFDWCWKLKLMF